MTNRIIVGAMRLGSWGVNFNPFQYGELIEACLDLGISRFDHADIYGDYTTEEAFGEIFSTNPSLRDRVELITKSGIRRVCSARPDHKIKSYDSSAEHIIQSVETSLRNFRTDRIDQLLLHRPDYLMEPGEIAEAVTRLQADGKVLKFGVSNFSPSQVELLQDCIQLDAHQVEVSLLHLDAYDNGVIDQAYQRGIEVQCWSPLGGGELFARDKSDRARRIQDVACRLAKKYHCAEDQIYLAWVMRHPGAPSLVLGTSKIERIAKAKEAMNVKLAREDWYELWQASTGSRLA